MNIMTLVIVLNVFPIVNNTCYVNFKTQKEREHAKMLL